MCLVRKDNCINTSRTKKKLQRIFTYLLSVYLLDIQTKNATKNYILKLKFCEYLAINTYVHSMLVHLCRNSVFGYTHIPSYKHTRTRTCRFAKPLINLFAMNLAYALLRFRKATSVIQVMFILSTQVFIMSKHESLNKLQCICNVTERINKGTRNKR